MASKKVILCVDDEKIVLDSLVTQLKNHLGSNYLYEMVENTDEGWEVIEEVLADGHELALVISDWLMPLEKGDQFLIDVHARIPSAALIMLSGHADEASVDRARKYAHLQCFVRKPWDKVELMMEVEKALKIS
jgi:response regulator RpfG family c-di-GMP phosphodiesterase